MISGIKKMRRLGPLGASLVAAALTAAAFAAISVADSGSDGTEGAAGAPGHPPDVMFERRIGPPPEISEEDRAAMEEFRNCMRENGADLPEPPELEEGVRPAPPEPPRAEERDAIEKALEACEDKLPEGAHFGIGPCGPDDEEGSREEQSGDAEGGDSEGAAA